MSCFINCKLFKIIIVISSIDNGLLSRDDYNDYYGVHNPEDGCLDREECEGFGIDYPDYSSFHYQDYSSFDIQDYSAYNVVKRSTIGDINAITEVEMFFLSMLLI